MKKAALPTKRPMRAGSADQAAASPADARRHKVRPNDGRPRGGSEEPALRRHSLGDWLLLRQSRTEPFRAPASCARSLRRRRPPSASRRMVPGASRRPRRVFCSGPFSFEFLSRIDRRQQGEAFGGAIKNLRKIGWRGVSCKAPAPPALLELSVITQRPIAALQTALPLRSATPRPFGRGACSTESEPTLRLRCDKFLVAGGEK